MIAPRTFAKLVVAFHRLKTRRFAFFGVFLLTFLITFSMLLAADFVPNAVSRSPDASIEETLSVTASPLIASSPTRPLLSADISDAQILARARGEYPVKVLIPAIGIEAGIKNPSSTDIAVLDEALLTGTVRYPTSAKLGTEGNVVLFGHSSYLPIVNNQAFKAFNGIQNLKVGEEIIVHGESGKVYVYKVDEVGEADAAADAIPLSVKGKKLTLSTCDSFGAKTARFIVVATLVETRGL